MSFITKRERVFNEYDLFDLPARNEGKLKAYASCTDARAWSHFCSDKSEHLVEIIKRNNESCRPKYIPTDVIVNTLMVAKNAEIARLKQRIEEFEQMLAAYDQLELTCDQKCEIANAHAAIKAANKELDDMYFDLDLSNFTEGIDSEAFETGKSRGDEPTRYKADETTRSKEIEWSLEVDPPRKMETKSNQMGLSCPCDASTLAIDPRIDELQDTIIAKDAKLNAMQNTVAVLENDVCEPYCIYAHIYTALEKIFSTLCQNEKYKEYLGLLTAGKDIRCIDLKGKILFKLKILEKFSLALIAPCSQDLNPPDRDCSCYRAEIITHVTTTYALTSAESKKPHLDNKRAQLVADIMDSNEIKEILSEESCNIQCEEECIDGSVELNNYCINEENLKRLKNLQGNFDDLMTCYESLKHDKECLQIKCRRYEELEKELETLQNQMTEYNSLWNEKEHYRKRSVDLDTLKEKYLVLTEETSNLEIQLKAEAEINNIKSSTIEELRSENLLLEKKLNEAGIVFEKERNALQCMLKEYECKIMCQEQQIKSLSLQVDRLLEENQNKNFINDQEPKDIVLLDEIESLKEQIRNLKEAHFCTEEEKLQLQSDFENNLKIINELKLEIEDWKSTNDRLLKRNDHLENYTENFQEELRQLIEENRTLSIDVEEKTIAIGNLLDILNGKSHELERVMDETKKIKDELNKKSTENTDLYTQLNKLCETHKTNIISLENEKTQAIISLQLARQESQELLGKIQDYNDMSLKQKELTKSLQMQCENYNELKTTLLSTIEENKRLHISLTDCENRNNILMQEIQRLREIDNITVTNIHNLQEEKSQLQQSLEITRKESEILEVKLGKFEGLSRQLQDLQKSHNRLSEEKLKLENELKIKNLELETTIQSVELSRKESEELLDKLHKSEFLEQELNNLNCAYQEINNEKKMVKNELIQKNKEIETLLEAINKLKLQNDTLLQKSDNMAKVKSELIQIKLAYDDLMSEKETVQAEYLYMTNQINDLNHMIHNKIKENKELTEKIKNLEEEQIIVNDNINLLENEKTAIQNTLDIKTKESTELISKLKRYNIIENEFNKLNIAHDEIKKENEELHIKLNEQVADLKRIEIENSELNYENNNLLLHNEDLEQALINARTELMTKSEPIKESYSNLIKEITEIKNEGTNNKTKIRELMDKLELSENNVLRLGEEVSARNNKIATLENYVNELEDEIRSLHATLDNAVNIGEQIKDYNYEKIGQIFRKMDDHHSIATHNIQMEIEKLSNENKLLKKELCTTKIKNEESSDQKDDLWSKIINLQNEREIIVNDIKQLELKAVGDSILSPNNCSVEDILNSLIRIQNSIEININKSLSLEQTLVKVQSSSQLLLSKADEAKKIIEEKRLKIISEKEEAIKQKVHMEKQLIELKERLENQIANDQDIINDLEAEILNQKLIIDKINDSRQNYISKLEDDLKTLKDLYEKSIQKVAELQKQIETMTQDNNVHLDIIKKANLTLEEKSKDISILQSELSRLRLKPNNNVAIQVLLPEVKINTESQTDKDIYSEYNRHHDYEVTLTNDNRRQIINQINNMQQDKNIYDIIPKSPSINEVQILTANIEPSFDYVRNSYKNYKFKQLSFCHLQYCSISCFSDNTENNLTPTFIRVSDSLDSAFPEGAIDIKENSEVSYPAVNCVVNKHSLGTNSLKFMNNETNSNMLISNGLSLTNSTSKTLVKNELYNYPNNNLTDTRSHVSADNKLFVIYRDSVSKNSYFNITPDNKNSSSINQVSESVSEDLIHSNNKKYMIQNKKSIIDYNMSSTCLKDGDIVGSHSKPKLNITLPKIETQSLSLIASSKEDTKSSLSLIMSINLSPNRQSTSETNLNIKHNATKNFSNSYLPSSSNDNAAYYNNVFFNSNIIQKNSAKSIVADKTVHVNRTKKNKEIHSQVEMNITIPENKGKSHNHIVNTKDNTSSPHYLLRVGAGKLQVDGDKGPLLDNSKEGNIYTPGRFGLDFIVDTVKHEIDPISTEIYDIPKSLRKTRSMELFKQIRTKGKKKSSLSELSSSKMSLMEHKTISSVNADHSSDKSQPKSFMEKSVMVKLDNSEEYENRIQKLTKALENIDKDYKKRIDAIKTQYDNNIKCIINEHNQGVNSIQSLHEETLQDIIKIHENEVESLRTMSIEAMKKVNRLERENKTLKAKMQETSQLRLDTEPVKISAVEINRHRKSCEARTLSKTNIEAFNVKPESRSLGLCTCSLGINISDTIRNIFEQVDVEQRKIAENAYLKYIANKILTSNVDTLDAQELSFLHLKVCRIWKTKLNKEEALQKKINTLKNELIYKQRNAQEHIAELDRKVAEERRRLQEVREAVCLNPSHSRNESPQPTHRVAPPLSTADKQIFCRCDSAACSIDVTERRSAGDLAQTSIRGVRSKRHRAESNRAVLANLESTQRREKRPYTDDPPTRLRKSHDRSKGSNKK